MDIQDFLHEAQARGLQRLAPAIAAATLPCIHVLSSLAVDADQLPVGQSRLGGDPDTPPGFQWPEWGGMQHAFLIQINLADLTGLPWADQLPSQGLLSFFYHADQEPAGMEVEDRGAWAVYHFPNLAQLQRTPTPKIQTEFYDVPYPAAGLTFQAGASFPDAFSDVVKQLNPSPDEREAYWNVVHALYPEPRHQMFGHPDLQQQAMEMQVHLLHQGIHLEDYYDQKVPNLAQVQQGVEQWRLLLQLDSDKNTGMMWGDVGTLYFWIRQDDLQARRFSNVWMMMQSG